MSNLNLEVKDNKQKHRFETDFEGQTAFIEYLESSDDVIAMTHTEVPDAIEGKGVGSKLVEKALKMVQESGKKVEPLCPFVAIYIERHPQYQLLIAQGAQ